MSDHLIHSSGGVECWNQPGRWRTVRDIRAPGGTRTHNRRVRILPLYQLELQVQMVAGPASTLDRPRAYNTATTSGRPARLRWAKASTARVSGRTANAV